MSTLGIPNTRNVTQRLVHPGDLVDEMEPHALRGLSFLIINMPLRESAKPPEGPIGISLLAARMRDYGASVSVIDLNAYRIADELSREKPGGLRWLTEREVEQLLEQHLNYHGEPDLIALSGMITTLRWQELLARLCRKLVPDAFIVSGGGLATEVREGLFSWIPELDAVAHSEGDDIILVLGKQVLDRKQYRSRDLRSIPQYLREMGGKSRFLYGGDRPKNLDILPFPGWDLLERDVFGNPILQWYIEVPVWGCQANNSSAAPFEPKRSLTTVSSRGCPYTCAFCFRGAQGERNWGMRSPHNLAEEMRWLIERYAIDFLGYVDDNFAVSVRRCEGLPEYLAEIRLAWGTHLRLDEADLPHLIPMRKAGCIYGGFGAESASAPVLERMKKGGHMLRNGLTTVNGYQFPTSMVDGIRNCRELGIHANCTWIMGYPTETLEDLKTSVAFILWQTELATSGLAPGSEAYRAAAATINKRMFTATAYPGTEMFKDPWCQELLNQNFGIHFDALGEPIVDAELRSYVEELDDATKVMVGKDGRALNFSAMDMDTFLTARSYIDSGAIEKVLDM